MFEKNRRGDLLIKINIELPKKLSKDAKKIVGDLEKAKYEVASVVKKEVVRRPYPPFTTSTMTQAGARIFGWSAKRTMSTAQGLYEEGLITYHRTDSVHIAEAALKKLRDYISEKYGKEYLSAKPVFYKATSKVAQEAHEAIRPTDVAKDFKVTNSRYAKDQEALYNLILRRFVACQMNEAIMDQTSVDVSAGPYTLRASGSVIKFEGWLKIFGKEPNSLSALTRRS